MPKTKQDCLIEFEEIRKEAEEESGWSQKDMARTVARMIRGAGTIAQNLALAAETMKQTFSEENPATPKDVQALSVSLQSVSTAINSYSQIYSWCQSTGRTGKEDHNALEKLLDHLNPQETRVLYSWLARAEVVA